MFILAGGEWSAPCQRWVYCAAESERIKGS